MDEYIYACMCVSICYNQLLICAIIPMYGYIHTFHYIALHYLHYFTLPLPLHLHLFAFTLCTHVTLLTLHYIYTLHYITLRNVT